MEAEMVYEFIGYAASALVITALAMTSIVKLRVFGLIGSLTFLAYSLLIEAYPIAVTNVVIISIHLWFLRKILRRHEFFTTLAVAPTSRYLEHFCSFYQDDIRHFVPGWSYRPDDDQIAVFVLRDMVPAGLLIAVPRSERDLEVRLDFVIPQYRDFKVGRFVYSTESGIFDGVDAERAVAEAATPAHARYLEKMGFRRCSGSADPAAFEKDLIAIRR
jgi:hypothetical protein